MPQFHRPRRLRRQDRLSESEPISYSSAVKVESPIVESESTQYEPSNNTPTFMNAESHILPMLRTNLASQERLFDLRRDTVIIAAGAAITSVGILSYYVLRYVTNVAMARFVPPVTYGIFCVVIALSVVLSWTAKLGLDNVLIRLIPHYRLHGEHDLVNGLLRFTTLIILIVGSAIGLAFLLQAHFVAATFYHDENYVQPVQELAILIPLYSLQILFAAGLQAFKQMRWRMLVDRVIQPLTTFIILLPFCFYTWNMEILSFSTLAGFGGATLVGLFVLSRVIRRDSLRVRVRYLPGKWFVIMIPMLLNGLLLGIIESTSTLLLGVMSTPIQVADYVVAERLAEFMLIPVTSFCISFSPYIVEYYNHHQFVSLEQLSKMVTRWSFAWSIPVFLFLVVFRIPLLTAYGSYYRGTDWIMILMAFGYLLIGLFGPTNQVLILVARPRLIIINSIVYSLTEIVLLLYLTYYHGAVGAALAFAVLMVFMYVTSWIQLSWIMKLQSWSSPLYKPLVAALVAALSAFFLQYMETLGPHSCSGVIEFGAMVTFVLVYCLMLVQLRLTKEGYIVFGAILARGVKFLMMLERFCHRNENEDAF